MRWTKAWREETIQQIEENVDKYGGCCIKLRRETKYGIQEGESGIQGVKPGMQILLDSTGCIIKSRQFVNGSQPCKMA